MIGRILERLLASGLVFFASRAPKCKACHVKLEQGEKMLFLIPVWTDNEYESSLEYYCRNLQPISSIHDIPPGQRACKVFLLSCPQCGERKATIVDFLRVRDREVIQGQNDYDMTDFHKLLEAAHKNPTGKFQNPSDSYGDYRLP